MIHRNTDDRACIIVGGKVLAHGTQAEIAANEKVTDDHLRTWLSTPHAQMPDMNLSRNEITALVSYFDSLRPN